MSIPASDVANCDWCFVPLDTRNREPRLADALAGAHAAACRDCVSAGRVLDPPDSLDPGAVELTGADAWRLAIAALIGGAADVQAAQALAKVAGYEVE